MAKRKRTETISLRVTGDIKRGIEALSNLRGLTATKLLEQLVRYATQEDTVETSTTLHELGVESATVNDVVDACEHETPELYKFRLYHVAPNLLSSKDIAFVETVLGHPEEFMGSDQIFDAQDNGHLKLDKIKVAGLNIEHIKSQETMIHNWIDFKAKNPEMSMTYEMFKRLKLSN